MKYMKRTRRLYERAGVYIKTFFFVTEESQVKLPKYFEDIHIAKFNDPCKFVLSKHFALLQVITSNKFPSFFKYSEGGENILLCKFIWINWPVQ